MEVDEPVVRQVNTRHSESISNNKISESDLVVLLNKVIKLNVKVT